MAKRVTFCAMALALTVIGLYAASAFSTGKLAALGLGSLLCALCVSRYGVRYGGAVYAGSSLLSLLLISNRTLVLLYALFAGYYPLVKLLIERLNRLWAEWLLKFLFFNLAFALIYFVCKTFFLPALASVLTGAVLQYVWLIFAVLQLCFALYDWLLSYMIGYYEQFLRRIHRD